MAVKALNMAVTSRDHDTGLSRESLPPELIARAVPVGPQETVDDEVEASSCRLVCHGDVLYGMDMSKVIRSLMALLKKTRPEIDTLLSGNRVILKQNIDHASAARLARTFERVGLIVHIERDRKRPAPVVSAPEEPVPQTVIEEKVCPERPIESETATINALEDDEKKTCPFLPSAVPAFRDEEDDDEEADLPADFRLRDTLARSHDDALEGMTDKPLIEIVTYLRDAVFDVAYLPPGKTFTIRRGRRKVSLVRHQSKGSGTYYVDDGFNDLVHHGDGNGPDLHGLRADASAYSRKHRACSALLSHPHGVRLTDDRFSYDIKWVSGMVLPEVGEVEEKKTGFHRFIGHSLAFHLVMMVLLSIIWALTTEPVRKLPETYFVHMDPSLLVKASLPRPPVKQPVAEPPLKKEAPPRKAEKKVAVPAPKPKLAPRKTVASTKKSGRKVAKATGASRSPKAGGGAGKGNVATRNINEAGLLGILGAAAYAAVSPRPALSAVTNLDAVVPSNNDGGGFTVGSVAGKLGASPIRIAAPGTVNTKGNTQVLRSYGAAGEGTVAALEKGTTGTKQVVGMVKADLTPTMTVQGGMSREAVKKVIDQHLDEITYCYETALIANPSIMGRVVFEWKILASGRVGRVSVKSSSLNSSDIHACIRSAVKTWQFPKPKGSEVIVSYPFIFDIVGF